MADRAQEILDDCDHRQMAHPRYECCGRCDGPCRPCADRAVEAAREEERTAIERMVECAIGFAETEDNGLVPLKYADWLSRAELLTAIRARGGKPNG